MLIADSYLASRKQPEPSLFQHGDQGLSFEALERSYADRPQSEIADAFNDLTGEMLLILARLLGREMAQQLAEELQAKMAQERPPAEGGAT